MRSARREIACLALIVVGAWSGCQGRSSLSTTCGLVRSPGACFRCQAERCASQLDQCYGAELREGTGISDQGACALDGSGGDGSALTTYYANDPRLRPCAGTVTTARCTWDPATQAYTKDCVYAGADSGVHRPACYDAARCIQACGCLAECARSCSGSMTAGCAACTAQVVAPCAAQLCAQECGHSGDGGP
jgi:hypothetical protein